MSPDLHRVLLLLLLLLKSLTLFLENGLVEAHHGVVLDLILALLKVGNLVLVNLFEAALGKFVKHFFGSDLTVDTKFLEQFVNFAVLLVCNPNSLECCSVNRLLLLNILFNALLFREHFCLENDLCPLDVTANLNHTIGLLVNLLLDLHEDSVALVNMSLVRDLSRLDKGLS